MIRRTHLPTFIFLQGPPQSGKDTVAKLLSDFGAFRPIKFAQPIITAMQALYPTYFSRPDRDMESFKRHDFGKYYHDEGAPVTGRDIMIAYSEFFMKELFGSQFFGNETKRELQRRDTDAHHWTASDSGFEQEAQPVFEVIPKKECAIIQLFRPTKSFAGDSRNYWTDPEVATFQYNNALDDLSAMQLDFIKWFNTTVFSFKDQLALNSKENSHV